MMEVMRPLAVEKERRNNNTAAASRVSQSVGRSLSQQASHHHYPSIVTIVRNNFHNHQPFEPIMHPRGWCTYRCRVPGERARSHRHRRAGRIYRSTMLHERINSKSSTNQTNHHNDKIQHSQRALVRPAASGSVKEKVVLQTTRTSTYAILMPEKSATESMMPQARSPEAKKGGARCAMK